MFLRPRVIPCLTIIDRDLVKTTKFKNPRYLGDPINAVKIFNGKGVDELSILNIRANQSQASIDFDFLKDIASEAFMPLSYGGGISSMNDVEKLFYIGYEKVVFNTAIIENPTLVKEAVELSGSQSIVAAIDVRENIFGKKECFIKSGKVNTKLSPIELTKKVVDLGVGEILLTSINRDGMMNGYDLDLVSEISQHSSVPVIANGGARSIHDIKKAIHEAHAHAVAASSMFVYYGKQKAILITVPTERDFVKAGVFNEFD